MLPLEIRMVIMVTAVAAVCGACAAAYKHIYDQGYDAAVSEIQEDYLDDLDRSINAQRHAVLAAADQADHWRSEAARLQAIKSPQVTKYVERIIEKNPDCTQLRGFGELWNTLSESE